jgi:hypothetical protein
VLLVDLLKSNFGAVTDDQVAKNLPDSLANVFIGPLGAEQRRNLISGPAEGT